MALATDAPQTRRRLVAGTLGGLAAVVGTALGRPETALAEEDPDAVHKNVNNPTTASTSVTCTGATSIRAISNGSGSNKSGVFAQANGTSSRGVTGVGVTGVLGQSSAASGRGVTGLNLADLGGRIRGPWQLFQSRGRGRPGRARAEHRRRSRRVRRRRQPGRARGRGLQHRNFRPWIGVFGQSRSPSGRAVKGFHNSTSGIGAGVEGETASTTGVGVLGRASAATGGTGVIGSATNASAIGGSFQGTGGAVALQAAGPVQFTTSGIVTIPSGFGGATVNPGVDITATSKILCTLMSNPGGTTTLHHVTKQLAADTFQILLTAAVTSDCKVAYFVIS